MTALLGYKNGINYSIKAHTIIQKIKQIKNQMMEEINVFSGEFSDGRKWCYLNVEACVKYILQIPFYQEKAKNQEITIKLSGDGRQSSNRCHFVLFTLMLLFKAESKEKNHSFNPDHCYSIGVFEGKENRANVVIFLFQCFVY